MRCMKNTTELNITKNQRGPEANIQWGNKDINGVYNLQEDNVLCGSAVLNKSGAIQGCKDESCTEEV